MYRSRLLIALAATLILSAAPAFAQSREPQQQNATQKANQEFDTQVLQKYVAASVEIGEIQNELVQKLEGIQDREEAMKLEQETARKKISAIENQGLDLQTYDTIAKQAHTDPELKKEINQIIETKVN